jgi:hypothetical protein
MMTLDLDKRAELSCPKCGKPLIAQPRPDGRVRFDGCGRDCFTVYDIPDGSGNVRTRVRPTLHLRPV